MVRAALVQFSGHESKKINIADGEPLVAAGGRATAPRSSASPELFSTIYFCVETRPEYFDWAEPIPGPDDRAHGGGGAGDGHRAHLPDLRARRRTDASTTPRRCSAPTARSSASTASRASRSWTWAAAPSRAGNEKFYFAPGDLGFPTFDTPFGAHRDPHLLRPPLPGGGAHPGPRRRGDRLRADRDHAMTRYLWDLELRAHAVDEHLLRVRREQGRRGRGRLHARPLRQQPRVNPRGEILAQASDTGEDIALADVDLSVIPELRALWGYYRDRRPDLYGPLAEAPSRVAAPAGG